MMLSPTSLAGPTCAPHAWLAPAAAAAVPTSAQQQPKLAHAWPAWWVLRQAPRFVRCQQRPQPTTTAPQTSSSPAEDQPACQPVCGPSPTLPRSQCGSHCSPSRSASPLECGESQPRCCTNTSSAVACSATLLLAKALPQCRPQTHGTVVSASKCQHVLCIGNLGSLLGNKWHAKWQVSPLSDMQWLLLPH